MLGKELSYRNMAALSATSRGARGMFDTDAYVRHMAVLQKGLEDYFKLADQVIQRERMVVNNAEGFFGVVPPTLHRLFRATKNHITAKRKELVFTIALVILAAAETYPWFRQAWTELQTRPENFERAFYNMGLDFVFAQNQGASRYVQKRTRLLKFVSPYLKYLEKNKLKTDIYITLDSAIEYVRGKIVRPLSDWMDARDIMTRKHLDISEVIKKTGDERIRREFRELTALDITRRAS
jgi:hypothetical protein